MTTSTVSASSHLTEESSLSTVTSVGCVFAALGSLGYISLNFVGSPREAYAHPGGVVAGSVATVGVVMLALALVRWRVALPGWAVLGAAAGLVFTAANIWFFSIGIVGIANHTDDDLFETIGTSGWMWAMAYPKMALCLVSFVALAIAGWRRRSIPRPAAAVLVLAGVVSVFPPHPPGLLLASLALFLISRAGMTSRV